MKTRSELEAVEKFALAFGRKRVPVEFIWDAFLRAAAHIDPLDRRASFVAAIEAWAATGRCRLPKQRADWRHDALPPMPAWIQVVSSTADSSPSAIEAARSRSWTPVMQFMANADSLPDLSTAIALDEYLAANRMEDLPLVPAKERSLEIFGHDGEKRLERLASTSWFRSAGLSFSTFRCFSVPRQPVHAEFPAAKPGGIIVSENESGYDSLCRAARAGAGFCCVVFGDGWEVERVVEFLCLKAREHTVADIYYIGDVDPKGLEIAEGLAARLRAVAGPELRPWLLGYEHMLAGDPNGPEITVNEPQGWLPATLAARARAVVERGERRAQEAVGWQFLAKRWSIAS